MIVGVKVDRKIRYVNQRIFRPRGIPKSLTFYSKTSIDVFITNYIASVASRAVFIKLMRDLSNNLIADAGIFSRVF